MTNLIKNGFNRLFRKKDKHIEIPNYLGLEGEYDSYLNNGKKLILCITVGRSGTRWLSDIFSMHSNAIGSCERHALIEALYRYIKWNMLPIDVQGIINVIKDSIVQDWKKFHISMVTSPYFSHDLLFLYNELKPEYIIWGVNDPVFTVTSFYNKGWYKEKEIRSNDHLIIGFQPHLSLTHCFSRIIPKGEKYQKWNKLSRIGKIAWLYNNVNLEINNHIKQIPKEKIFIFKLEEADQNYKFYLKYAEKFGLEGKLSKDKFLSIKERTVRKSDNIRKEWSEKEKIEFEENIKEFYQIYKNLK